MEFKDRDLEAFWEDPDMNPPRRIPSQLRRIVYRKLQMIDAAADLRDLRIPPSNHLEKLQHDRAGQHSTTGHQHRDGSASEQGAWHNPGILAQLGEDLPAENVRRCVSTAGAGASLVKCQ